MLCCKLLCCFGAQIFILCERIWRFYSVCWVNYYDHLWVLPWSFLMFFVSLLHPNLQQKKNWDRHAEYSTPLPLSLIFNQFVSFLIIWLRTLIAYNAFRCLWSWHHAVWGRLIGHAPDITKYLKLIRILSYSFQATNLLNFQSCKTKTIIFVLFTFRAEDHSSRQPDSYPLVYSITVHAKRTFHQTSNLSGF